MIEDSKEDLAAEAKVIGKGAAQKTANSTIDPIAETIEFDDFAKVDLRIARIVKAEHVEGADKSVPLRATTEELWTTEAYFNLP